MPATGARREWRPALVANDPRRTRNTRDANPSRPNVVILNPPTAWRPLRGRMQTLRVFLGYCCTAAVHGEEAFEKRSGRRDLNPRPLDPQDGGVGVFAAQRGSGVKRDFACTCTWDRSPGGHRKPKSAATRQLPQPSVRRASPIRRVRTMLSTSSDAGVPVHVIRKIAGHGSLSTTQRYLHPDDQSITDAGDALNAHISVRRSPNGPRLKVV